MLPLIPRPDRLSPLPFTATAARCAPPHSACAFTRSGRKRSWFTRRGLPTPSMVDPNGLRSGWQRDPGQLDDRDLKFFDAILATLCSKYRIDDRRIYATGFSSGAIFSFLLRGERAKTVAAIGVCAGVLLPTVHVSTARPVIHIAGEADTTAPFSSQVQTMQAERDLDGCLPTGHHCGEGCTHYESAKHTPVVNSIHPGGHVYPPWATEEIVRVFKEQKR